MLSFIYRIANEFEQEHGFRPNVLYLNHRHYTQLRMDLSEIRDLGALNRLLGMEIVLETDLSHPHTCWSPVDWQCAVAV